jgi:serine/threonine-protein kinase/endoribonuclease IRE1
MERDPPDPVLVAVETGARDVVGVDWLKALDRSLIENLGKYRKYDGASVRDLLRVVRNKVCWHPCAPEPGARPRPRTEESLPGSSRGRPP